MGAVLINKYELRNEIKEAEDTTLGFLEMMVGKVKDGSADEKITKAICREIMDWSRETGRLEGKLHYSIKEEQQ